MTSWLRILLGSTTGAATELLAADAVIRTSLPLSRRVAVVGLGGGSGTTAVTTVLAGLIAGRRTGPVLAVDAAGGFSGLTERIGGRTDHDDAQTASVRGAARTLSDARTGLAGDGSGLSALDLARPGRRAASVAEWREQVSPIARFFDLVVTDWGVRPASMDLAEAAATSHVVVVVSRADRFQATVAGGAIAALEEAGGPAQPVLVLTDVARTADRMAPELRRRLGVPVHLLPYARNWSPLGGRRPAGRSRLAHIRLTAAVMSAAIGSRSQARVGAERLRS